MIIRRCVHCGTRLEARNQSEFESVYDRHVKEDHAKPQNVGEVLL